MILGKTVRETRNVSGMRNMENELSILVVKLEGRSHFENLSVNTRIIKANPEEIRSRATSESCKQDK
jgi:hypothetical protein